MFEFYASWLFQDPCVFTASSGQRCSKGLRTAIAQMYKELFYFSFWDGSWMNFFIGRHFLWNFHCWQKIISILVSPVGPTWGFRITVFFVAVLNLIWHFFSDIPWGVQLAAVYALCDLSPSNPAEISRILEAWRTQTSNTIPSAIVSCLEEVGSLGVERSAGPANTGDSAP